MIEEPLRFRVAPAQGESDDGLRPRCGHAELVARRGGGLTVSGRLPVSLVIPTIGRIELLRDCLRLASPPAPRSPPRSCSWTRAAATRVAALITDLPSLRIRRVASDARNIAVAYNVGIRAAHEAIVAVTHDDCTVAPDWLEVGMRTVSPRADLLATGRVMPDGDAGLVPSCKTSEEAREYRGEPEVSLLFPANMVVDRSELMAIGGFDEAFARAAEDGDLCFRWLRSGRTLRYEPAMTVWHRDWRIARRARSRSTSGTRSTRGGCTASTCGGATGRSRRSSLAMPGRRCASRCAPGCVGGRCPPSDWRHGLARGLPAGLVAGLAEQARHWLRRRASL